MFNNLQALRAFAAISVLIFHFSLVRAMAMPVEPGSFGVDLFFVLSGFIIAYSAEKSPRHFLLHRFIRVFPPYWIATTIGLLLILATMNWRDAFGWWGQSLFFLTAPKGHPTIIFVAWTLVYEIVFYLVYAVLLRVDPKRAPFLSAAILLVPAWGLYHFGLPLRSFPLFVEFLYGLAIFLLMKRLARVTPMTARWLGWIGPVLVVAGLFFIFRLEAGVRLYKAGAQADAERILQQGLPAAAIVLGLLLAEQLRGWRVNNRLVLALGNASYAIYLLHTLFIPLVAKVPRDPLLSHRLLLLCGLGVLTVGCALLYCRVVEAPTIRVLRRAFGGDGAPVAERLDTRIQLGFSSQP